MTTDLVEESPPCKHGRGDFARAGTGMQQIMTESVTSPDSAFVPYKLLYLIVN
jgi:hypothetical protein